MNVTDEHHRNYSFLLVKVSDDICRMG